MTSTAASLIREIVLDLLREECQVWGRGVTDGGYGRFYRGTGKNKRRILAHRDSYEYHHGPIPPGMVVRHKCDNPPCINPEHLELGTPKDNTRDMHERGRAADFSGESNPRALLSRAEVEEIREGYASGLVTQDMLGDLYGVSRVAIGFAVRGETWT